VAGDDGYCSAAVRWLGGSGAVSAKRHSAGTVALRHQRGSAAYNILYTFTILYTIYSLRNSQHHYRIEMTLICVKSVQKCDKYF